MAKSPNWTLTEVEYLQTNYPTIGALACSKYLDRSEKAVNIKASRLGLKMLNAWNKKCSTEEYIHKLICKGIKYLPIEEYILDDIEILHKCPECNTSWKVRPNNILNGSGCPECNKGFGYLGTSTAKYAYLYLVEINSIILKLGITTNIVKRFSSIKCSIDKDSTSITPLIIVRDTSDKIISLEQGLLKSFGGAPNPFKYFNGCTELVDIQYKQELQNILLDYLLEDI